MKRFIAIIVTISFIFSNFQPVWAQSAEGFNVNQLPVPGTMVTPSQSFVPVLLKGLVIHPNQPFNFDFIVDSGNDSTDKANIQEQSQRMIRYFLTALTIPAGDLWVNLSPYEKDRIITNELGQTDMGRDMLAQDYVLKQLTASLIYPEKDLGKEFWNRVYKKVEAQTGNTNIPVNTFNKVWIVPNGADVFEHGNAVYVTQARLKVMLEEDYLSLKEHNGISSISKFQEDKTHAIGNQVVREIILPEIEKEVNEGQNFALLRQVYYAAILAKWYRTEIQKTILAQVYLDKKKTGGIDLKDNTIKEQIYQRYLRAYKKGVFNFIKEDSDNLTGQIVPRKYFSGGEIIDERLIHEANVGPEHVHRVGRIFDEHLSVAPEGAKGGGGGDGNYAMNTVSAEAIAERTEEIGRSLNVSNFEWIIRLRAQLERDLLVMLSKERSPSPDMGLANRYLHDVGRSIEGAIYNANMQLAILMEHELSDLRSRLDSSNQIERTELISIGERLAQLVPIIDSLPRNTETLIDSSYFARVERLRRDAPVLVERVKDKLPESIVHFWDDTNNRTISLSAEAIAERTEEIGRSLNVSNFEWIIRLRAQLERDLLVMLSKERSPSPDMGLANRYLHDVGRSIEGAIYNANMQLAILMEHELSDLRSRLDSSNQIERTELISIGERLAQLVPIIDSLPRNTETLIDSSYFARVERLRRDAPVLVERVKDKLPESIVAFWSDPAMLNPDKATLVKTVANQPLVQGGIDLNQININRTGHRVNLQFDAAQRSEITRPDFKGFRIIINSVTQVQNPLSLMGVRVLK